MEFIGAYVGEYLQYQFASSCLDKVDLDSFQLASTAAVVVVSAIIAVFVVGFFNGLQLQFLKSEYHASDALRAWRPQKMADSRVYMSDL